MISLKEWMEIANYRITEGGDYYGFNGIAYSLSSWNGDQNGHSLEIIFDPKTQVVYQVEACDYKNQRAYRLTNPDAPKDDKSNQAWDNVNWIDLETDEDWLEKAEAICMGVEYDTRVQVPLDLDREQMFELMKMAHESDLTLNEFVEDLLREFLKKEDVMFGSPNGA